MTVTIIGLFFIGPIQFLPEEAKRALQSIPFFVAGLVVFGAGCAFAFVPLIPELLSIGRWLRDDGKGDASHAAAALVSACFSAGAFFAPILSGSISDAFG